MTRKLAYIICATPHLSCLDWDLGSAAVRRFACGWACCPSGLNSDLSRWPLLCRLLWRFVCWLHCRPECRIIIPALHPSRTPSLAITQFKCVASQHMGDLQQPSIRRSALTYRTSSDQNHVTWSEQWSQVTPVTFIRLLYVTGFGVRDWFRQRIATFVLCPSPLL